MLIWASLVTIGWGQLVSWGGTCQKVPLIADFDITKYAGSWKELIRYPVRFEDPKGKCVTANYAKLTDTTVEVNNTQIVPIKRSDKWRLQWGLGEAEQLMPDTFPNKLYVSFDSFTKNYLRWLGPNYNVMDTDYDNYTVVMGCMGFWFFKIEFGWILGRQDIRNTELYNEVLERAINDFGFKTKGTIEPPQVDCTYDFVNEY